MALRKSPREELSSNQTFSLKGSPMVSNENTVVPASERILALPSQQVPAVPVSDQVSVPSKQTKNTTSWMKSFEEIKPSKMSATKEGALSMVNSKNGKRIKLSKSIIEEMDSPQSVRFLVNEAQKEVHIISDEMHVNAHSLTGKNSKNTLYSASLVTRLTLLFGLDYSTSTSHTFGTWTVSVKEGTKVITIRLEQ